MLAELKPSGVDVSSSAQAMFTSASPLKPIWASGYLRLLPTRSECRLRYSVGERHRARTPFQASYVLAGLSLPRTVRIRVMDSVMHGIIKHQKVKSMPSSIGLVPEEAQRIGDSHDVGGRWPTRLCTMGDRSRPIFALGNLTNNMHAAKYQTLLPNEKQMSARNRINHARPVPLHCE